MMNKKIKGIAKDFFDKYGFIDSYSSLKNVVKQQGYTIIEFSDINNNADVQCIIDELLLNDLIEKSNGFTFANSKYRLIFIKETLSEQEKLIVLAHEEGHIFCNHLTNENIVGKDVVEEHEANEFSHYILQHNKFNEIRNFAKKHKKIVVSVAIIVALMVSILLTTFIISNNKSYYGDYYVTETGNKYHERECIFVKDKTNIHKLTNEEFESGNYSPCQTCLPD